MSGSGRQKFVVGLIGGVGSGKSRVATEFEKRGACVISGDQLGHEALRQPEIRKQVVERWGRQVLDPTGEVDRRRLGRIVFDDAEARKALEDLVFPYIRRGLKQGIKQAGSNLVIIDAAILLEASWNQFCNRMVFIHAPQALRLERIARQRGWDAKEVEAREHAQLSLTEKVSRADDAIDNSGSAELLSHQVERLLRDWQIDPTNFYAR